MHPAATTILEHLREVDAQRAMRLSDSALDRRVQAIKRFQHARFLSTHGDLLENKRYGAATRFFLEELYGPRDFAQRDAQFSRVVPALVKLFPRETVDTVCALAALHALSEALDTQMALHMPSEALDRIGYVQAWQATGRPDDRERQIRLTLEVGRALDRYTRNPLMRHSLRMMRGTARAAGLPELQSFLERGFDTFAAMRGADAFLDTIVQRERALAARLFQPDAVGCATTPGSDPLGQLP